jgi:hypothetical protein
MSLDGTRLKIALALALYLLVLGALVGVLIERWRFDQQRTYVLPHYDAAVRSWQVQQMAIESATAKAGSPAAALPAEAAT